MPINYKVIEKGQPGVVGGGTKKFYAQIELGGELTIDEITKTIEKFSALSESDIRGVIIAVENVIQDALADGKIIRLEKIGSLYPAISSVGEEAEDKVSPASIKRVKVNYRPGKRLNKVLTSAEFHKVGA